VERFLREAVVLGSLKHANIVQIYDAGGGGPNLDFYLEMEYVEGATLRNFIKTHEFDWERILKFIKQVGSAIQKIHDSGIIHRDLNPRNIMVDKNGDLKVMDFGVAKIIGVEGLTRDGQVVGTTDYIAPEQSRGERVDERADIYSFGVILYELCTKRLPSVPPLPLHQYQFDVPEWLEDIIARCLKPDREQRYASMKEVLAAMEAEEKRAVTPVRCAFHPQKDAVAVCVTCGKKICEDCRYTLKGKHYCHQCAEKILEIPPPVLPKPKPIVEPAPAPVLSVDCNRLDFKDVGPGSTSAKSFIVRNTGTGKLTGGVTTSREWLKVVPNRLDLDKGQKDGVSVTADATGLPYGFKDIAYVNIVTSGGSAKIRVRLSTSVVAKPAPVPVPRKRSNRKKLALFTAIGIAVLVPSLLIITPRANKVLNVHSDTSAPVISSVQVTSATENSAVITWATDERSTTWAMFNAPELGFSLIGKEEDKNLVYNHKFEQASLEPGVWYVVTVYSTDANGNTAEEEFEFTTPGQSGTILKLIFSDDFSNPDSGWWDVTPSEGGEADAKYQDGGYRIIVKQGDSCWWMLSDKVGQLGDFVFEVDAKWLSQLASTQGCYGVAFRDQDLSSNYYMFWVNNSDQTYIIWKSIFPRVQQLTG
jgi:serine/threonine protein kinase